MPGARGLPAPSRWLMPLRGVCLALAGFQAIVGLSGHADPHSPSRAAAQEAASPAADPLPPPAARSVDFVADVQPIFARACYSCHGAQKQESDYRLDRRASALAGGAIGGAILPGKSAESPLIRYVAGLDADMKMPVEGQPLTAEEVGMLRAWIDQGANWPDSADVADDRAEHWAYQPLATPVVPATHDVDWARTPIDAFVLARLEARGMQPRPRAEPRELIRRLYFDLVGLPPTIAAVEEFVSDDSPHAYARLVDQLLASPRYGERWARHWLDVVHFAETHGHDQDRIRAHAWPYRDWLVRAFNDDLPYGQFVEQQLAGDVLNLDDPAGIAATGFISAGPWDESSQLNIVDDTIDKRIAQNLDRDDMVTTTMSTFLSATVHCARCHNHKFDPISQTEYYGLQAVFAGVDRANREYDVDPAVHRTRRMLRQRQAELAAHGPELNATLLEPTVQAEVAAWEAALGTQATVWTVLDPVEFTSSQGATPVKQSDLSVLYTGTRPATDTYTVVAPTDFVNITGVRLEVLSDESLPQKGPGRQDNGNLHLSEFRVARAPRSDPANRTAVMLKNPTADFNQDAWTIAMAIDGKPETAWGIHPAEGKSHQAVFELEATADASRFEAGSTLTFTLEQLHGREHLIGRVRLSVTDSPQPVGIVALPDAIQQILNVPTAERNDDQRASLALYLLQQRVAAELGALPPPGMVYAACPDFVPEGNFKPAKTPRTIQVLKRGDVNSGLEPVGPGALACIRGMPGNLVLADAQNEGERRAGLARWITDPRNSLTWRSIVNRVWHYHFGRGIVETPNDLGRMGAAPTHPELLDWLAGWFRDQGGSLKQLHGLIVTSAVYQQSSQHDDAMAALDANNSLLWRMNRTRLDAESIRDAVLQVTGKLDVAMYGPSVKQFVESPGIHVTPMVDYAGFNVDSPESFRRSTYRFLFRTLPDPFMDSLDCADASQLTPTRNTSVSALQALTMLNNHFLVRQCEHFASRLEAEASGLRARVALACQLALGRVLSAESLDLLCAHAERHGLANACRLILNSNEFMFVP